MPNDPTERPSADALLSKPSLNPALVHHLARALCFAKHGDWRYDPGNPKHSRWYAKAEKVARGAGFAAERISNSDGAGSWPRDPSTERSETYRVRTVGPWVNEDSATTPSTPGGIECREWRAVGFDDPEAPDTDGQVFEYSEWTTDRRTAERAAASLRADDPPFDDVWLERRLVSHGQPERVDG